MGDSVVKPSLLLARHRLAIRRIVARHNAANARVFGSALHGDDDVGSDLDLLVDPLPQMSLMDVGAIRVELIDLLGVPVDVVTPEALPESFRRKIVEEAEPV